MFRPAQALHLEDDVGPGLGAVQAWIGEAQAGTHNLAEALKSYEKAAAILAEDEASYDDARCDLAMVYTKIGNTFVKMGKLGDASAAYAKACTRRRRLNGARVLLQCQYPNRELSTKAKLVYL